MDGQNDDIKTPEHQESEYIFDKKMVCVVCDQPFTTKVLKNSKARRIGADLDLRPRFAFVDTVKYGVCACPHCGYAALHANFERLSTRQIHSIKDQICSKYTPKPQVAVDSYDYNTAIEMHQLALFNAYAKLGKDGEKAYLCLLITWLMREKLALEPDKLPMSEKDYKDQIEHYYNQAFEGFQAATMNEMFPIMGMNESTVDYLIACMALHFNKLEMAAKYTSSVLTSSGASRNVKDKALELKEMIVNQIRESKTKK